MKQRYNINWGSSDKDGLWKMEKRPPAMGCGILFNMQRMRRFSYGVYRCLQGREKRRMTIAQGGEIAR